MKPPTSEKVVFSKGSVTAERIQRGKQVGTRVLDSVLTPASYRYSDRSVGKRRMAETERAQASVADASDALRQDFRDTLQNGVQLESPTKQGGKITATGIEHDEDIIQRTTWSLKIESPKGKVSAFTADVKVRPGSQWVEKSSQVGLDVIDPEKGRSYNASSYMGEGEADAHRTVVAALQQLHEAHNDGSLIVGPMPAAAHQSLPDTA